MSFRMEVFRMKTTIRRWQQSAPSPLVGRAIAHSTAHPFPLPRHARACRGHDGVFGALSLFTARHLLTCCRVKTATCDSPAQAGEGTLEPIANAPPVLEVA
jgi:hypothetical protein